MCIQDRSTIRIKYCNFKIRLTISQSIFIFSTQDESWRSLVSLSTSLKLVKILLYCSLLEYNFANIWVLVLCLVCLYVRSPKYGCRAIVSTVVLVRSTAVLPTVLSATFHQTTKRHHINERAYDIAMPCTIGCTVLRVPGIDHISYIYTMYRVYVWGQFLWCIQKQKQNSFRFR